MPVLWKGHRWEDYQVRIIDLAWNQIGTLGTTYKLRGVRSLYGQFKGELTLSLDKRDPWAQFLLERQVHFIQVLRDGLVVFEGFQIKLDREDTVADAERWIEFAFLPLAFLLHWRVGMPEGIKLDWNGPLDDNFKEIVRFTIGPSAPVTPTTLLARIMPNFSVQANVGAAPNVVINAAGQNIYEIIQQYAAAHLVDWDIVFDANFHPRFRTWYPRRGTDRTEGGPGPDSARCIFSDDQGNFVKQSYGQDTSDLKTVMYDRLAGTDVSAGPTRLSNWLLREGIINSGDADEMLVALRNADLKEWYKLEEFKEQEGKQWQRHFWVGDRITWKSNRLGYGPHDDTIAMMEFEIDEAGFEHLTPTFGKPEPDIRDNLRGGGRARNQPGYTAPTIWHIFGDTPTNLDPDAANAIGVVGDGATVASTEVPATNRVVLSTIPAGLPFAIPALTFGAAHAIGAADSVIRSDAVVALGITCDDANTVYPLPAGPNRWTFIGGTGCQTVGAVANTMTLDTVWIRGDIDATGAVVTGLHPTDMAGGFTEPVMIGAGSDVEVANWQADAGYVTKLHVEGNIWAGRLVYSTTNSLALAGWHSATENIVHIFDPGGRISKLDVYNIGVRHHMFDADIANASYIRGFFEIRDAAGAIGHTFNAVTGVVTLNVQRLAGGDFSALAQAAGITILGTDANTRDLILNNVPHLWPAADAVGALISDGAGALSWGPAPPAAHNILSASHGDAVVSAMTRGDLVVGTAGGWDDLAIGGANTYLHSDAVDATWQQIDHTHIGNVLAGQHHALVTLGAPLAANLLGLAGQALSLDVQAANLVFSGPAAGGAVAPTFRALVAADLPAAGANWTRNAGGWLHPTTGADHIRVNYDTDVTSYIGRTAVGFGNIADHAWISHVDRVSAGNYALIQSAAGYTAINCSAGQVLDIKQNNAIKVQMDGTTFKFYSNLDAAWYTDLGITQTALVDGATGAAYFANDADVTSYIGRTAVGFGNIVDHAWISHVDRVSAGNYALIQTAAGGTRINSSLGQEIYLNINNAVKIHMSATAFRPWTNNAITLGDATPKRWSNVYSVLLNISSTTTFGAGSYNWPANEGAAGSVLSSNGASPATLTWVAAGAPPATPWTDTGAFLHPTAVRDVKGDAGAVPGWELFAAGGAQFRGDVHSDARIGVGAVAGVFTTWMAGSNMYAGTGFMIDDANVGMYEAAGFLVLLTDQAIIAFGPGSAGEVYVEQGAMYPVATGVTSLGKTAGPLRWGQVASVLGNFTGTITAGSAGIAVNASGDVTIATTKGIINTGKVTAGFVLKSDGTRFQGAALVAADLGGHVHVYNETVDQVWNTYAGVVTSSWSTAGFARTDGVNPVRDVNGNVVYLRTFATAADAANDVNATGEICYIGYSPHVHWTLAQASNTAGPT